MHRVPPGEPPQDPVPDLRDADLEPAPASERADEEWPPEDGDDVDPVGPGPVDLDDLDYGSDPPSALAPSVGGPTGPLHPGYVDLGFARLDTDRAQRTGDPEVVYGAGKTPQQVIDLLRALRQAHPDRPALATRLTAEALAVVAAEFPSADADPVARACVLGSLPVPRGRVCVVAAGTSDAPVAAEAALTVRAFGAEVEHVTDVGVAGIHRLLASRERLEAADCLIVVAGMEGALPSVVGGLTGVPIVAVPTSVGYGASFEGLAALLAMLNSCAPGVVVCNIDNGFGAGVFAARVARRAHRSPVLAGSRAMTLRRIGWLDCSSGASGDMLLGALVGAGVPSQVIADAVATLGLPVTVDVRLSTDGSLAVHQADVTTHEEHPPARTLSDVVALLGAADLEPAVRGLAVRIFERLARAEAVVHGTAVDTVHFHEVGALDALADVVGCAAGFVHLGLEAVVVSPVALGSGRARTAHGELPVPVPAVLELLRGSGLVTTEATAPFEQCTPTGAAVLASVTTASGPMPAMAVSHVGVGAGTRRIPGIPNVLRLVIGSSAGVPEAADRALVLSTNVDDLDPRVWPAVLAELLDAGASDAWLTPILMKKGRPAHTLSVLCVPELATTLRAVVFRETSALGLREQVVEKHALDRTERVVSVDGGSVRVKLGWLGGQIVNAQPEYDDVAAVAHASGRPVKAVLAEATAAARTVLGAG